MSNLKLRDLPPDAIEKLKPLSHEAFDFLSIEAGLMREADQTATYPTDPLEALYGVWATFRRKPESVEEDLLDDLHDAVRVACLVLGRETDLDAEDCRHLWAILNRAESLIRWQKTIGEEMRLRMWKVLEMDLERKATERSRVWEQGPASDRGNP